MNKILLTASRGILGKDLEAADNPAVVVENGTIVYTGSIEEGKKKYPDAEVKDLGDKTLIPGLIDCHSHTSMDARVKGHLEMMNDPAPELTLRAVRYAYDDIMSGITTSRILGDKNYVDVSLRNSINRGELPGPRLLVAGIGMRSIHGHGFVGVPHTGKQEFRTTSRNNMLKKVQWLKVFVTAGAPPVSGDYIPSFISLGEIKAVTAEAKRMGIHTSAHCIGGEGLRNCIKGGIDVIDHAYCATDEDLELIKEKDRWICLTPSVFMDLDRNENNPPAVIQNTELGRERVTETMKRIVKSGVKYAIGSDALHASMGLEAYYATVLGASNKEALAGVTIKAAKLCRVEQMTGSLEEGKAADIVAVSGNPLDDINALRNVTFVMKEGKIFKQ